ncbi:hypothetical protein D3C80_1883740 [compost metagenome]
MDSIVLVPLLPMPVRRRVIHPGTQACVPLRRVTQRLALAGRVHNSASSANSRHCSVALAMYLVTELTETPKRTAISA